MKKFIFRLLLFCALCYVGGEIIVRVGRLASDIPERYMDDYGIQRYKPGQTGYYTKVPTNWYVNKFGWLGITDTTQDTIISVVGDSFVENMMNPIDCNQAAWLRKYYSQWGFFEAGRSGVTLIEAMEITKILDIEVKPKLHLIYLGNNDFYESLANKQRILDRVQIDIKAQKILPAELKSPFFKKFLYANKFLYYLYLRFPLLVDKNNKNQVDEVVSDKDFDNAPFEELMGYIVKNYDTKRMVFVFQPKTQHQFVEMSQKYGVKTIWLDPKNESWEISKQDPHWTCYGHEQVAKQVAAPLPDFLHKAIHN